MQQSHTLPEWNDDVIQRVSYPFYVQSECEVENFAHLHEARQLDDIVRIHTRPLILGLLGLAFAENTQILAIMKDHGFIPTNTPGDDQIWIMNEQPSYDATVAQSVPLQMQHGALIRKSLFQRTATELELDHALQCTERLIVLTRLPAMTLEERIQELMSVTKFPQALEKIDRDEVTPSWLEGSFIAVMPFIEREIRSMAEQVYQVLSDREREYVHECLAPQEIRSQSLAILREYHMVPPFSLRENLAGIMAATHCTVRHQLARFSLLRDQPDLQVHLQAKIGAWVDETDSSDAS